MRFRRGQGRFGQGLRALLSGRALRVGRAPSHRVGRRSELESPSHKPLARLVADQLFSRVAGADRIGGNAVHLLKDGKENYEIWLAAIAAARLRVDFENYIIRNDATGRRFAEALAAKAREGVTVRVLYDWLGCLATPRRFWRALREAGVQVRCFNRPSIESPFGWLSRNHRKTIGVDGEVGFVAGLCVGQPWVGDPARRRPAWRDTGIEVRGPALADLQAAFAESWAFAGGEAPLEQPPPPSPAPPAAGDVAVRIIGSKPNTMGIYRFDQVIAGMARQTLWLTDAYFVGTTAYVRTLCDAARDGVDVRLLVPGASDLPVTKALSRVGYRPLLEAGIRVFEWNGPMLHAKTAVADRRWSRIGSSNLNVARWMGPWELDVVVEDETFSATMEAMFVEDLENATEIVLGGGPARNAIHSAKPRPRRPAGRGSPGRLAAGAVGLGSAVTAAITNHRTLGPAEAVAMASAGTLLLVLAALAVWKPLVLTLPFALLAAWIATTLLVRAARLRARGEEGECYSLE